MAARATNRSPGLIPLAAALVVAGLVVAGGPEAFWLCVPVAVLAAALCRTRLSAALLAGLAGLAAAAPLALGTGPLPSPLVAVPVIALSAGFTLLVRGRLEAQTAALRRLSRVDELTGLGNRRLLDERLEYEVARHSRHDRSFAVLMLDLDGFKLVNDRFGHAAGDEVLRDVGAALARAVRGQDTVVRQGGDEFCVLAPETGRLEAVALADRLEDAVERATPGLDAVGASVGAAIFPDDGRVPTELVAQADARQADEKRRRRSGVGARPAAAVRRAA